MIDTNNCPVIIAFQLSYRLRMGTIQIDTKIPSEKGKSLFCIIANIKDYS